MNIVLRKKPNGNTSNTNVIGLYTMDSQLASPVLLSKPKFTYYFNFFFFFLYGIQLNKKK
jgi:hypothetical protein